MLNRPVPKTELYIKAYTPEMGTALCITTSPDADNWLNQEAPLFGRLEAWQGKDAQAGHYWFYINAAYDYEEIIAYFNSYNDQEKGGQG